MKNNEKEKQLINEKQEAIKEIYKYLETIDICNDIRLVVEKNKFSHQFLADIINCDRSNIANIFTRKNNIDLVQLILISVALDCNFFEKIINLIKTDEDYKLPDSAFIEFTPNMVRIIPKTSKKNIIVFQRQEE